MNDPFASDDRSDQVGRDDVEGVGQCGGRAVPDNLKWIVDLDLHVRTAGKRNIRKWETARRPPPANRPARAAQHTYFRPKQKGTIVM
jgi:hypothetical protein